MVLRKIRFISYLLPRIKTILNSIIENLTNSRNYSQLKGFKGPSLTISLFIICYILPVSAHQYMEDSGISRYNLNHNLQQTHPEQQNLHNQPVCHSFCLSVCQVK